MNAVALYTPEVLQLATSLADFPWDDALPLQGSARSRSCGSAITIGLAIDGEGEITKIGLRSQACAIGQAAAAIFANSAGGHTSQEIQAAHEGLKAWLANEAPMPAWPGLDAIARARDYPGRHAAILLAWQAASEILPMN